MVQKKQIPRYSESVLLAYFSEIAQKGLIASLWPKYSMLKATLNLKENIDISKFSKLIMFIKRQKEGYTPKKSKIALIFGVAGAMRSDELIKLETNNVKDLNSKFLISINTSKTEINRLFIVVDNEEKTILNLIRQYISLRPAHTPHKRFFINYRNNKCSTQPVGINTFSKLPFRIASFLKLEQPHLYTGHCFRRSSASILSDAGADFAEIKRHGGWKSTSVAEGYIETSMQNKINVARKVFSNDACSASTSGAEKNFMTTESNDINLNFNTEYHATDNLSKPSFSSSNCTITNVNIHIHKNNLDD
ncbi:hypothetical protein RN001_005471 [Aquatica leii]|uniref:Tyr recombinase domain-containing protein n=1 Tax=Aquatica leii TaxID=1421715 RepID=A0AAN7SHV8_9COLE|nr:hypothetical protein RN001_005471 [Aquatica leii]